MNAINKYVNLVVLALLTSCGNEGNDNSTKIKMIENGMRVSTVDSIMESPIEIIVGPFDKAYPKHDTCCFIYIYEGVYGGSGNFSIWFSKKDSVVVGVYHGN